MTNEPRPDVTGKLAVALFTEPPHHLDGLTDVCFGETNAHRRGDRQEAGIELAVACVAFGRKLHKLRAPVPG
jgi:hypothetical protein